MPPKKSIHFPDSETGEIDKPATAAGRKSLKMTTGEHRVSAGEKGEDTISGGSRRSRSSQGSKTKKGLMRKSVKMGTKIIEELLATESTEVTHPQVMTGIATSTNRRKSDKQETGSAHSQVKVPLKSKSEGALSTGSRGSSFTKKKRISKKSGTDEAAPVSRKASSKSSAVSLTRKSFAPQKWSFKKSLQSGSQEGGIEESPSKKDLPSFIKKKLSKVRVATTIGRASMRSQKSGTTVKSKGSTKTLKDLQLTPSLFNKFGKSDDEENQKVWSLRTALRDKKMLKVLGIVLVSLLLVIVIIAILATVPRGGGQGSINVTTTGTATTMMSTPSTVPPPPPMTTDKCGGRPPSNNATAVGQYCRCSGGNTGACRRCCEQFADSPDPCKLSC